MQDQLQRPQLLGGPQDIIIPSQIGYHNHLAQAMALEIGMDDLPNIDWIYIPCAIAMYPDDTLASSHVMLSQPLRAGVNNRFRNDTTHSTARESIGMEMIQEVATEQGIEKPITNDDITNAVCCLSG